jgi:hypothetical protein
LKASNLDENCKRIFTTLVAKGKLRFNELYEIHRTEMAKPTLSLHLKHLVNGRFVVRKVEDVQNVSYQANLKKLSNTETFRKNREVLTKFLKGNIENFVSLSLDEQIGNVFCVMMVKALHELKARIEFKSDPCDWQKELTFSLWADPNSSVPLLEKWLVTLCVRDEQYRKKVFEKIEQLIRKVLPEYDELAAKMEREMHGQV